MNYLRSWIQLVGNISIALQSTIYIKRAATDQLVFLISFSILYMFGFLPSSMKSENWLKCQVQSPLPAKSWKFSVSSIKVSVLRKSYNCCHIYTPDIANIFIEIPVIRFCINHCHISQNTFSMSRIYPNRKLKETAANGCKLIK